MADEIQGLGSYGHSTPPCLAEWQRGEGPTGTNALSLPGGGGRMWGELGYPAQEVSKNE